MNKSAYFFILLFIVSATYGLVHFWQGTPKKETSDITDARVYSILKGTSEKSLDLRGTENARAGWWLRSYTGDSGLVLLLHKGLKKIRIATKSNRYKLNYCQGDVNIIPTEQSLQPQQATAKYQGISYYGQQREPTIYKKQPPFKFILSQNSKLPRLFFHLKQQTIQVNLNKQANLFHFSNKKGVSLLSKAKNAFDIHLESGQKQHYLLLFRDPASKKQDNFLSAQFPAKFKGDLAYEWVIEKKGRHCYLEINGFEPIAKQKQPSKDKKPIAKIETKWQAEFHSDVLFNNHEFITQNLKPVEYDLSVENHPVEDEALAGELIKNGLLTVHNTLVTYPNQEAYLICKKKSVLCPIQKWNDKKETLLKKLYFSAPGKEIQSKVNLYNERVLTSALLIKEANYKEKRPALKKEIRLDGHRISYGTNHQLGTLLLDTLRFKRHQWANADITSPNVDLLNATSKITYKITAQEHMIVDVILFGKVLGTNLTKEVRILKGAMPLRSKGRKVGQQWQVELSKDHSIQFTTQPLKYHPQNKHNLYRYNSPLPISVFDQRITWKNIPIKKHKVVKEEIDPKTLEDNLKISSADGTVLYEKGQITFDALNAGLSSLLGINQDSIYHFPMALKNHGIKGDVTLTLDLKLQQKINAIVTKYNQKYDKDNAYYRTSDKKQLSFVLMDASDQIGALKAVATNHNMVDVFPEKQSQLLNNQDRDDPEYSLLRWLPGFHKSNAYNYPGSIFKLMTSLSLFEELEQLKAAGDCPNREQQLCATDVLPVKAFIAQTQALIDGISSRREYKKIGLANHFAFDPDDGFFPHKAGIKFEKAKRTGGYITTSAGYLARFTEKLRNRKPVGLEFFIQTSYSPWFSWMAARMTPALYYQGGHKGILTSNFQNDQAKTELFPLFSIMKKLGYMDTISLIDGKLLSKQTLDHNLKQWNGAKLSRSSGYLSPVYIDKISSNYVWHRMAIGYQIAVTPVHIATLSASIYNKKAIRPYLVAQVNESPHQSLPKIPLTGSDKNFQHLKNGMDKVTREDGNTKGTAYKYLRNINQVWAKTGTITIPKVDEKHPKKFKTDQNGAWMTGFFCTQSQFKASKGTVKAKRLNIRADASTQAQRIAQLKKGDEVELLGKQGRWYQIRQGWVWAASIQIAATTSTANCSKAYSFACNVAPLKDTMGAGGCGPIVKEVIEAIRFSR